MLYKILLKHLKAIIFIKYFYFFLDIANASQMLDKELENFYLNGRYYIYYLLFIFICF